MPHNNTSNSGAANAFPPYTMEEWVDDTKRDIHNDIGRTLQRFNMVGQRTRWLVHGTIDIVGQGAMSVNFALIVWLYVLQPLLSSYGVMDGHETIHLFQLGHTCVGIMLACIAARILTLLPLAIIGRNLHHYNDFLFRDDAAGNGLLEKKWLLVRLALRHDIVVPLRAELDRIADKIIQIRLQQMHNDLEAEGLMPYRPTLDEASEVMRRLHSNVILEWSHYYLVRATAGI